MWSIGFNADHGGINRWFKPQFGLVVASMENALDGNFPFLVALFEMEILCARRTDYSKADLSGIGQYVTDE